MPVSISSLRTVDLDYTAGGPGLNIGMKELEGLLALDGGRKGHLLLNVAAGRAVIPAVISRDDLYVLGFQCGRQWFRFSDAVWPFTEAASSLGYDGQYGTLGGLTGSLTYGAIRSIDRLADIDERPNWKEHLRTLLVSVAECARLIPVRMQILGLLNGVIHTGAVPLSGLAHYIQNWKKASGGEDMREKVSETSWRGFQDPTIIRR